MDLETRKIQPNAIRNNLLLSEAKDLDNALPPYLRGEDLYADPEDLYADEEY